MKKIIPLNPIEEFAEDMMRKHTRDHAFTIIRLYLSYIYNFKRAGLRLTEDDKKRYEELAVRYLKEDRDRDRDVIKYFQQYEGRTNTMTSWLSVIKCFLHKYGQDLEDIKAIHRKLPKKYQKTQSVELDVNIIKRILEHGDEKTRSIALIAAQSGMRIGEILFLRFSDIKQVPEHNIYRIFISGDHTKTGRDRTTFISENAMKSIEAWQRVRPKYIKEKKRIGNYVEKDDEDRIFPFNRSTFNKFFANTLKRADLYEMDPVTHHLTVHIHAFRNWFRIQMISSGVPEDTTEKFLHYNSSNHYQNYTSAQLIEAYVKAQSNLLVDVDIELQKRYKFSQAVIEQLTSKNQENELTIKQLTEALLKLLGDKEILVEIPIK